MPFGLVLITTGMFGLTQIGADTSYGLLIGVLFVMALGMGATMMPLFTTALKTLTHHESARGSTLLNSTQQIASSVGVAVISIPWMMRVIRLGEIEAASARSPIRIDRCGASKRLISTTYWVRLRSARSAKSASTLPVLTPTAAVGLAVVMVGAVATHARRPLTRGFRGDHGCPAPASSSTLLPGRFIGDLRRRAETRVTTTTTEISTIDEAKLETFVGQAVTDMGAAISGLLLHIGDRLGLYKAMAGVGPITSSALAQRTGTTERYVREWLGNQAAGGYVIYHPAERTYELPAEQAMVVANEDSPVFLGGAFEAIAACYADHDVFVDAFRTGAGVGWHEHDDR